MSFIKTFAMRRARFVTDAIQLIKVHLGQS